VVPNVSKYSVPSSSGVKQSEKKSFFVGLIDLVRDEDVTILRNVWKHLRVCHLVVT
jgi:hypothetical protein